MSRCCRMRVVVGSAGEVSFDGRSALLIPAELGVAATAQHTTDKARDVRVIQESCGRERLPTDRTAASLRLLKLFAEFIPPSAITVAEVLPHTVTFLSSVQNLAPSAQCS